MSFIERFIKILRTAEIDDVAWRWNAELMGICLEDRLRKPKGDGFDIDVTGDDDVDRAHLADWIEKGAHAGPYLSPPFGRNFSEAIAWLLRAKLENQRPVPARACHKAYYDDKYERQVAERRARERDQA